MTKLTPYNIYLDDLNLIKAMKKLFFTLITCLAFNAIAQDGTIYPLEAPKEPNAIPLIQVLLKTNQHPKHGFANGAIRWHVIFQPPL